MGNKLSSFYDQILNYEKQIDDLRASKKKWYDKYKELKGTTDRASKSAVNKSELEHVRVRNSQLMTELNKAKRDVYILEEKLKQIKMLCK